MIKKTLYFGNPAYLKLRNAQLVIELPEIVNNKFKGTNFLANHNLFMAQQNSNNVVISPSKVLIFLQITTRT